MNVESISDIGKVRSQNQDTVFASTEPVGALPNLFMVADGMGGHRAGDVASSRAVAYFCEYIRQNSEFISEDGFLDLLTDAVTYTNVAVYKLASSDPALSGMGTTLTACVVLGTKCLISHVGDSRAYLMTHGQINQLTTDHSYVNEMLRAGQLTPEEAREHPKRNVLTRVLGIDPTMTADGYVYPLEGKVSLLLCSDGLTNMLTDEIIALIASADASTGERAQQLINEANRRGGNDNISVVLIDIGYGNV